MVSITVPTTDSNGAVVNIDTARRITTPPGSFTCSSILKSIDTKNPNNFLKAYSIDTFQANLAAASTALSAPSINGAGTTPALGDVSTFLTGIKNNDIPVLQYMLNCIQETKATPDLPSYMNAKESLQTSKDRLELLHEPEKHVSYYEGWFPITRPIKEISLFILFGAGIFLLLLAVLFLVRTQGVEVNIATPTVDQSGLTSVIATVKSYGFLIIATGLLIGYLVNMFNKRK
jgi:hypothetical protein